MARLLTAPPIARALLVLGAGCIGCGDVVAQTLVARGAAAGAASSSGGSTDNGGSAGNSGATANGGAAAGGTSGAGAASSGGALGTGGSETSPPCPNALLGFAATMNGTSGGIVGRRVRANSAEELRAYVAADEPLVVEIATTLALTEELRPKPNKTIVGIGASGGLTGAGFYIKDSENVVIRNLTISKLASGDVDAIGIDGTQYVWIDHCDLSTSLDDPPGTYDGLIDVTHGSDFVTLSWNRLHDHDSVSVIGHSDFNATQDSGHLRVTLHHNYFRHVVSDTPRARFGQVHLFNNYFEDVIENAAISQMGADVVLERNYFLQVPAPIITHFTGPQDGNARSVDDVFVPSSNVATIGTLSNWDPSDAYAYRESWDSAASVPVIVSRCAGVGKAE